MNLEGKLLGNRYEIIEKIGNGGMATVYKATDKVLKRNAELQEENNKLLLEVINNLKMR